MGLEADCGMQRSFSNLSLKCVGCNNRPIGSTLTLEICSPVKRCIWVSGGVHDTVRLRPRWGYFASGLPVLTREPFEIPFPKGAVKDLHANLVHVLPVVVILVNAWTQWLFRVPGVEQRHVH